MIGTFLAGSITAGNIRVVPVPPINQFLRTYEMKFYPGSARKSKWPSAPYAPDNPQTNAPPAMKPPAAMGTVPSQADTNRPKRKENHTTNQRRKANNERHHREQKQDGAPPQDS